jgi:hypothetical protein
MKKILAERLTYANVVSTLCLAARVELAMFVAALALSASTAAAAAQTYTVTNPTDSGIAGDGSLRGELAAANANPGADTIDFAGGLSGTITLSGDALQIKDLVDIEGPGPSQLTVAQGSPTHRVIHIELKSTGPVTIAGLHIANGTVSGPGGDIQNDYEGAIGALTVSNCLITGGTAGQSGGGIDGVGAPLIVRSSTISGNQAESGGGIWLGGPPFTIENSTISANSASNSGGGIIGELEGSGHSAIIGSTVSANSGGVGGGGASITIDTGATLTIANSTFAGNSAGGEGAGGLSLFSEGESTTIEDSTFVGNRATGSGVGGLQELGATSQRLLDTIVAGNAGGSAPDIGGNWTTAFSLIGNPAGATLTESVPGSDLLGVDPQLGPLQDNGGPTQTMAPAASSPALNRGGGSLGTDQRGDARPVLYPGVPISGAPGANGADIGAYELQAPPVPLPSRSGPRVRVSCPKRAKPGGCRFALEVVAAKPKRVKGRLRRPKPESTVARVRLAAGSSVLVALKPKQAFTKKLATAKKVLVKETVTIRGATRTSYRELKVVQ